MEKINIAEILKDCPKGMELDCMIYDNIVFDSISDWVYPIRVTTKDRSKILNLTKYGCNSENENAKCVIFPKGKTTWEGFVPPCKFKTGDVLYIDCANKESDGDVYKYIFILKEIDSLDNYFSYCYLSIDGFFPGSHYLSDNRYTPRLATEEERQKLFDAIKANGYKWNPEIKTLEKLEVKKFDITTLKPFDKVLTRITTGDVWGNNFFGYYKDGLYHCSGHCAYRYCIPYENNKHLLATTNDCDDFYKTWK